MGNMKANRKFVEGEEAVSAVIGVILMVAITVAIAATVYVYVSGMLTGPGESAPNIAWAIDDANDQLKITSGSAANEYAAAANDANLIFKVAGVPWYVRSDLALTDSETDLCETAIGAGDIITNFAQGEYQIIWEPTDKLLGSVTFT